MSTMQDFHAQLLSARDADAATDSYVSLLAQLTGINLAQVEALNLDWGWWS